MGDGFEVLIWLAVMGFIGIRSSMKRSRAQAASQAEAVEAAHEVTPERPPATRRERPTPRRRPHSTQETAGGVARISGSGDAPAPPARRGSGVLSRFADFAAEIERQMQDQQEAARAAADEREGETVLVPGRRVVPRRSEVPAAAQAEHASHWTDWEAQPQSHSLHTGRTGERHAPGPERPMQAKSEASKRARGRRSGLERLESYGTLKRAVILADVLGPPPGLDGISPAERRLENL